MNKSILRFFLLFIITQQSLQLTAQKQSEFDSLSTLLSTDISVKEKADVYRKLGWLKIKQREYSQARDYYDKSIEFYKEINNPAGVARGLNGIGNVYAKQSNYKQALNFYFQALKIDEEQKIQTGMASEYGNIALIYDQQGRYSEALEYYMKSFEINKALDNRKELGGLYRSIGSVYRRYEFGDGLNYKKALEYYHKALEIYEEEGNPLSIANVYQSLGGLLIIQNKAAEALPYYLKAIEMAKETGGDLRLAYYYNSLGGCYIALDSLNQALSYTKLALQKAESSNGKNIIPQILEGIGDIYQKKQQLSLAVKYYNRALEGAQELGILFELYNTSRALAPIEADLGNYKRAYELHVLFKEASDSLVNEKQVREMTQKQADFDFQQERDSVQLAQMQERITYETELKLRERNQQFTLVGLLAALIIAVVSFRFYHAKKKANQKLTTLNEQISEQKEEIQHQAKELQSSNEKLVALDGFKEDLTGMLVHDLKNPLNTIVHSVEDYNPENNKKIKQAGHQLHNLVLNILDVYKYENSQMIVEQSEVSLSDVVQKSIDDTSLLVINKSIALTSTIPSGIQVKADQEVLLRVFANLLTNALKYTPQHGTIQISAAVENEGMVNIRVADSGKGIPPDQLEKIFNKFTQLDATKSGSMRSTGLGLTFCKMAVEAHKGQINVESEVGKGTTFLFTLPLSHFDQTAEQTPSHETPKPESDINLSPSEKETLAPIIAALSQTLVFEVGKVKAILKNLDQPTEEIKKWEEEVHKSILILNEAQYKHLLHIAAHG
ncbi:MAG: tetratricopeptide repeat-containing sensor histidine kinase [Cyclobacteriaceae bacterium]